MRLRLIQPGHPGEADRKRVFLVPGREPAVFGAVEPQGGRDPVFEAITRTFDTLDREIIDVSNSSNVPDCQFGGSTALAALRIGQARRPCCYPCALVGSPACGTGVPCCEALTVCRLPGVMLGS